MLRKVGIQSCATTIFRTVNHYKSFIIKRNIRGKNLCCFMQIRRVNTPMYILIIKGSFEIIIGVTDRKNRLGYIGSGPWMFHSTLRRNYFYSVDIKIFTIVRKWWNRKKIVYQFRSIVHKNILLVHIVAIA